MASRPQAVAGGVNSVTKEKPDGEDPGILRKISLRPSVSFDSLPFALPPAGFSRLVLLLDDYSARPIP
jgi:hypothetical protein